MEYWLTIATGIPPSTLPLPPSPSPPYSTGTFGERALYSINPPPVPHPYPYPQLLESPSHPLLPYLPTKLNPKHGFHGFISPYSTFPDGSLVTLLTHRPFPKDTEKEISIQIGDPRLGPLT
ncbi:hypothetical protein M0802_009398 [Mischocyttarus mexicanus]|nr:hypothetical protein M0802_009398 [Mischocyttarus mexicanus]